METIRAFGSGQPYLELPQSHRMGAVAHFSFATDRSHTSGFRQLGSCHGGYNFTERTLGIICALSVR